MGSKLSKAQSQTEPQNGTTSLKSRKTQTPRTSRKLPKNSGEKAYYERFWFFDQKIVNIPRIEKKKPKNLKPGLDIKLVQPETKTDVRSLTRHKFENDKYGETQVLTSMAPILTILYC